MTPRVRWILVVLAVFAAGCSPFVFAGEPLYVTGPAADRPGEPYRWEEGRILYKTDRGALGNLSNTEADAMVAAAFQVWQNVGSAEVSPLNEGKLPYDVTASNILSYQNSIGACGDVTQPMNSIIYDQDGGILEALGMDKNSVLGFSGILCVNNREGFLARGWVVMNGRFIDGKPNSIEHASVTLAEYRGVFIHEFGHLIGLGHSQINVECAVQCSAEDLSGVPTMFPRLVGSGQSTPNTDDIAWLSLLYPDPGFSTSTGRIQGRVLFADGVTPAQGYNVIARNTANPRIVAVSSVSGFAFTAGAGNPLVPDEEAESFFFGSHAPDRIGFYDIPGLPPGTYTLEAESIPGTGSVSFTYSSGVGPIGNYLGFQYMMPGTCDVQYLHYPPRPEDDCDTRSTVRVEAGQIVGAGTDIILIGSPPRFDAWEDDAE